MLESLVSALPRFGRDSSGSVLLENHPVLVSLEREFDRLRERLVDLADEFEALEARYDAAAAALTRGTGSPDGRSRGELRDAIEQFLEVTDQFLAVLEGLDAILLYRRLFWFELASSPPCGYCGAGGPPDRQWLTGDDEAIIGRYFDPELVEMDPHVEVEDPPIDSLVETVVDAAEGEGSVPSVPRLVAEHVTWTTRLTPLSSVVPE